MSGKIDDIRQVVREHLAAELLPGEEPDQLGDDRPLVTGGLLDSLAAVRLITFLEERFAVRFAAHEVGVDYLDTVAIIADVVSGKLDQG